MVIEKRRFKKIDNNGSRVLACFARSYDENHVKSGRIHLISSVVLTRYEFFQSQSMIENMNNPENNYKDLYTVFNIVDEDDISLENLDGYKYKVDEVNQRIRFIHLPMSTLLGLGLFANDDYKFSDMEKNFRNNIFGEKNLKNKDNENICRDSLFIFSNEYWGNIVLDFNKRGIDISGGTGPKRHVLNTVNITLYEYLEILYDKRIDFLKKYIVYNGFDSPYLSSKVNLKHLKSIIDIFSPNNLELLKWKDVKDIITDDGNINLNNVKRFYYNMYKNKNKDNKKKRLNTENLSINIMTEIYNYVKYFNFLINWYVTYQFINPIIYVKEKFCKLKEKEVFSLKALERNYEILKENGWSIEDGYAKTGYDGFILVEKTIELEKENKKNKDEISNLKQILENENKKIEKFEKELLDKNVFELEKLLSDIETKNKKNNINIKKDNGIINDMKFFKRSLRQNLIKEFDRGIDKRFYSTFNRKFVTVRKRLKN